MTDTQDINSPARQSGRRRSDRIVGASSALKESVDQATRAARASAPVLVVGANGSGRGHLARAIHAWSPRATSAIHVFAPAGTPEPEHMRELFGAGDAGPGAGPGAGAGSGALGRAGRGTLLIEQIEHLAETARAALLQGLRQSAGDATRARVLATAEPGAEPGFVDAGFEIVRLAPLGERREDVLPLATHFLAEFTAQDGRVAVGFTTDARRWLIEEAWLGNVAELSERIRQAVRLAGDGAISAEALMLAADGGDVPSFKEAKRAFETRYVEGLLRRCNGNISRAARLAKKDRKDFYDVIRRTGVDPAEFRP